MNRFSEQLLSLEDDYISLTDSSKLIFGNYSVTPGDAEDNHFNEGMIWKDLDWSDKFIETYICFLAVMSDEEIDEYMKSFQC